jgi:hypothetical protein
MDYGFDLGEWVADSELETWASQMHNFMGWPHMLMARKGSTNLSNTDVKADNHCGPDTFSDAISQLEPGKPYVETERFLYERDMKWCDQVFDLDTSLSMLWRMGMAEGAGAIWGSRNSGLYPNPEYFATAGTFFDKYFRFDMSATETLSDGIGMQAASNEHYVFYKQNASSIQVDLSGMNGQQPAVAVDTRAPYQEVGLGTLNATNQTISLPHSSDWAIAIGNF